MAEPVDLAIVGAGPAGLSAARAAVEGGLAVTLIDDQPRPGGQIYRAIGTVSDPVRQALGEDYARGEDLIGIAGHERVVHFCETTVWQLTPELEIYLTRHGAARVLQARHVILATGAQERPMPFTGWTLPGVATAGAGQILLKTSGMVPSGGLVLAGSGPLLFLLAAQFLAAGGRIDALVETTPRGNLLRALRHGLGALRQHELLRKGVGLIRTLRRQGVPHFRHASGLEAVGDGKVEALRFVTSGRVREIPCALLLVHQGVVPDVQMTRALDLRHDWDPLQRCWRPRLGACGATGIEGLAVAGDGGGIAGAEAAETQGRLAGLDAARRLGALDEATFRSHAGSAQRVLSRQVAARQFLDVLYAPAGAFRHPSDETIVCRCEEVRAGQIRDYVRLGCLGPNQTKAFGRPGMGPCQGRFCGLTVSEIIAEERGVPIEDVGYYRIRPPIKPVTLAELAAIDDDASCLPVAGSGTGCREPARTPHCACDDDRAAAIEAGAIRVRGPGNRHWFRDGP